MRLGAGTDVHCDAIGNKILQIDAAGNETAFLGVVGNAGRPGGSPGRRSDSQSGLNGPRLADFPLRSPLPPPAKRLQGREAGQSVRVEFPCRSIDTAPPPPSLSRHGFPGRAELDIGVLS